MGLNKSKPENPYVRDRVRLCDGLAPFEVVYAVAAAGAGRYVFILGKEKEINTAPEDTEPTTYQLDYVDQMLSTRVRLTVENLSNFGDLAAFYALDERTLVLVDIKATETTLRQRLIAIDPEKATVHAFLDRGYQLDTRGARPSSCVSVKSAVSEDRVITTAKLTSSYTHTSTHVAIVYPKDPFNREMQTVNLTNVLVEADSRLFREVSSAQYQFRLSEYDAPFFLSPTKIGLIVDRHDIRARELLLRPGSRLSPEDVVCVDYSHVVAYDLLTDEISILRPRPDPVTNFPCNHEQRQPYDSHALTVSSRQLGLLITDHHLAREWNVVAARVFEAIADFMCWMMLMVGRKPLNMGRLSKRFFDLWNYFHGIRRSVLDKKKYRFGILDTQTLEWREQPGVADQLEFIRLYTVQTAAFPDGHILIYNKNNSKVASRLIGTHSRSNQRPTEELRILTNPGICFSLKTLSEMQMRKRSISRLAIMQIAARIQY